MKSIAGSIVTLSGALILTFGNYREDTIMLIAIITMIVGAVIILKDKSEEEKSED